MNRQTEQAVSEKRFRPRPARRLVEQRGQEVSQCLPQRQPPRQPQRQHRLPFCPQLDRVCCCRLDLHDKMEPFWLPRLNQP